MAARPKQTCVNPWCVGGEFGTAIRAASRNGHIKTAFFLREKGGNPGGYLLENGRPADLTFVKTLGRTSSQLFGTSEILFRILIRKLAWQVSREFCSWRCRVCARISFWWVCSGMFVAECREDVRISIPAIAERLNDSDSDVRKAAIELFSRLGAQGVSQHHFLLGVLNRGCS